MEEMNSRERVWTALSHKEPDRVPIDFASTHITGIHREAYRPIAHQMRLPDDKLFRFQRSGLADPDERFLRKTGSDVRGVWPNKLGEGYWAVREWEDETHWYLEDEWGATWKKAKDGGLYYDVCEVPLNQDELEEEDLDAYQYPVLDNPEKFTGMYEKAKEAYENGYAIFVENPMVEIFHSQTRVRGFQNFFTDLLLTPDLAVRMMETTEERMEDYFARVLDILQEFPIIVRLSDDLGSQSSLLMSGDMYRTMVKPLHRKLIDFIHSHAKNDVKIFFHSDGAIHELIPDLIEIGVDILNPIQYTCTGMSSAALKKEFGKDLCFWGGGIDTQTIFREGTVEQVRDEVRRQIETLAPGGGFVFSQVHNFQKGTDPEKFWAVWETVQEYGKY